MPKPQRPVSTAEALDEIRSILGRTKIDPFDSRQEYLDTRDDESVLEEWRERIGVALQYLDWLQESMPEDGLLYNCRFVLRRLLDPEWE